MDKFNNSKFFITCFASWQFFSEDTSTQGLADKLLLDDHAAIIVLAPVGLTYVSINKKFFSSLIDTLFSSAKPSVGKAINIARNFSYVYTYRMFNIWGDPSLKPKFDITLAVNDPDNFPTKFGLSQNYPNPFNPTTTIKYQVSVAGNVSIKIYNLLGKEIAELLNENKKPGSYEVVFDAAKFPSGVYFYRIQAEGFVQTKKMVLLK